MAQACKPGRRVLLPPPPADIEHYRRLPLIGKPWMVRARVRVLHQKVHLATASCQPTRDVDAHALDTAATEIRNQNGEPGRILAWVVRVAGGCIHGLGQPHRL